MELIQGTISFFQTHWVEILAVIGAVDIILGIITKWTPTKIDDNIYAFIHNFIARFVKK